MFRVFPFGTGEASSLKNVSTACALGAPTSATNGTIALGGTSTGTLEYTGLGDSTDRVINLASTTGGAMLTQSGASGLLKFTSALTATGAGSKTLTLSGSTSGTGELAGAIVNNSASNTTSLVKSGSGTWTLSGVNTYTGSTTVNGGTLTLKSAFLADASDVAIASGAVLNLNYSGTDTVGTLSLGGTPMVNGTYDSTTSPGFITGSGKLLVTASTVVNLTVSPTSNGSVTGNLGTYTTGNTATLTAVPAVGYAFTGWTGDASGAANPLSLTMNASKTVGATFVLQIYTLTTSATTNGSITGNTSPYNGATTATLTAVPANSGFAFTGWTGDASGAANPLSVLMDANKTIGAVFTPQFALTTSVTGSGSISGNTTPYLTGTTATLTATPASGYAFTGWSGSVTSTANPLSVTMDAAKNIVATFTPIFTLTTSVTGSGSLSGNTSPYLTGTTATLTATPASGFVFTGWSGSVTSTANPLSVTMDAAKNIVATFTPIFTLTTSVTGNGSVTGNTSPYLTGTIATLTATAASGSIFTGWSGDVTSLTNPLSVTMTAKTTIVANFSIQRILTITAPSNGTISGNTTPYPDGAIATLTATPSLGYLFSAWTGADTGKTNALLLTMDADKTLGATFVQDTADNDGDGLSDLYETGTGIYVSPTNTGTSPLKADTDGDGLSDGDEVNVYHTNPLIVDTDSDGVSDYQEVFVTHTDPLVSSFGTVTSTTIPYTDAAVYGDYEGMVTDPDTGIEFKQTLRISSNGSFTTKLLGLRTDAAYHGTFTSGVFLADVPSNTVGVTSVKMSVVKQTDNTYRIQGSYESLRSHREKLYFELRHIISSYAAPGKVTFAASLAGDDYGPQGSVVATGLLSSNGKVSFSVYLPDGNRCSYSGSLVNGNLIMLYTKGTTSQVRPVLVGTLALKDIASHSDFSGDVRLFRALAVSGTLFPWGYDQVRSLIGSRYDQAAAGALPLSTFVVKAQNVVFKWTEGDYNGVSKVATWATNNAITVPSTVPDKTTASFTASTGLLLVNGAAKGYAVALQKNSTFMGYYTSSRSTGSFGVTPN